jgi:tRNA(Ile)-lysidine synthase
MKETSVLDRVEASILSYNMLPGGARIAVAVSGGADSVCLLTVLCELAPRHAWCLEVAHFNHKQRGEESDEDERFVADLAHSVRLPFHRAEAEPGSIKGNFEQAARRARRAFFLSLGMDRVALGHTRDDQAETVLFRFLRGSHTAGLAGILPVTTEGFVRPLLEIPREEIRDYLRQKGIAWREDSSNANLKFARNRIRNELLPDLRAKWNPRIDEALANMASISREEELYWAEQFAALPAGTEMPVSEVSAKPAAVARRLIRRAILQAKGDLGGIEFRHVESVLALARKGKGHGLARLPGVEVLRSLDWLLFRKPSTVVPVMPRPFPVPGCLPAPDGRTRISLEVTDTKCATLESDLDWQLVPGYMELRTWRHGDHYRPAGSRRDWKLKDLFQRARVASWRRQAWPIISSGDNILWARQFGVSHKFVARGTARVLRIREEPYEP